MARHRRPTVSDRALVRVAAGAACCLAFIAVAGVFAGITHRPVSVTCADSSTECALGSGEPCQATGDSAGAFYICRLP